MLFDEIIITVNKGGDGGGGTGSSNGMEINITSVGLFDNLYQEENEDGLCSQPQKIR
ncbi:hypothetical protein D3C77_809080 [compost metagenome]